MVQQDCTELIENGRIVRLALGSPPENLVTPDVLAGIGQMLDLLESKGGPDLGIVCGSGTVFSKGFDVNCIGSHASRTAHRQSLLLCNDVCSRLAACPRPVIAAINGACLGAGLELALACSFRLCADKARLGLPELSRGLLPGLGGIHRLVGLVGRARALDMIAAGNLISAEEALQWGLVQRVLQRADFMQSVLSFARGLLSVDQLLIRETLRLTALAAQAGDQAAVTETIDTIVNLSRVADPHLVP